MTTLAMDNTINHSILSGVFAPASYTIQWSKNLPFAYATPSKAIFSDVGDTLTFLQSKGVVVEEFPNVESFLTNNSSIVAHLYDIPQKVHQYFGNVPSLKLGLFSDPDSPKDDTELFLEVETSLSPKQANDKLSQINREWLLKSKDEDLAFFNITLKFI